MKNILFSLSKDGLFDRNYSVAPRTSVVPACLPYLSFTVFRTHSFAIDSRSALWVINSKNIFQEIMTVFFLPVIICYQDVLLYIVFFSQNTKLKDLQLFIQSFKCDTEFIRHVIMLFQNSAWRFWVVVLT